MNRSIYRAVGRLLGGVAVVVGICVFALHNDSSIGDVWAQTCTGGVWWCGLMGRNPFGCLDCNIAGCECVCVAGNPGLPYMGDCNLLNQSFCGKSCEDRGFECGVNSPCYWFVPTPTPTRPPSCTCGPCDACDRPNFYADS